MSENNRKHFRVDEEAYVVIRHVPKNNIRQIAEEINQSIKINNLASINKNILDGLAITQGKDRQFARLLSAMNEKMDYILKKVEGDSMEETMLQPINISSGGCRFHTTEIYDGREVIDIRIRFSNLVEIRAMAIVIFSRPASQTEFGPYEMACEFKAISSSHQEAIDKRVMLRQKRMLRERQEAQNS